MASMTATFWPALTACPSFTLTSMIGCGSGSARRRETVGKLYIVADAIHGHIRHTVSDAIHRHNILISVDLEFVLFHIDTFLLFGLGDNYFGNCLNVCPLRFQAEGCIR